MLIWNIFGVDYCCIVNGISEIAAVNLLRNVDFSEKSRLYIIYSKNIINYKNRNLKIFLIIYKSGSKNYNVWQ